MAKRIGIPIVFAIASIIPAMASENSTTLYGRASFGRGCKMFQFDKNVKTVGQMESAIDVRLPSGAPWKFHIEATDKQTLRFDSTVDPDRKAYLRLYKTDGDCERAK